MLFSVPARKLQPAADDAAYYIAFSFNALPVPYDPPFRTNNHNKEIDINSLQATSRQIGSHSPFRFSGLSFSVSLFSSACRFVFPKKLTSFLFFRRLAIL